MPAEKKVSNEIFVDTSFILARVNKRDAYHARADELTGVFAKNPLVTTDAVILEIGNALSRNFKTQAVEIIDYFFNSPDVEVVRLTPELWAQGFALYRSHLDKQWGLVDCISFSVMRNRNIAAALTFDQHFVQAGFAALMRDA